MSRPRGFTIHLQREMDGTWSARVGQRRNEPRQVIVSVGVTADECLKNIGDGIQMLTEYDDRKPGASKR